jgi:AcrR family transcriptional regulator
MQHRGERRVARLLDAAVAEFAAAGYGAATMSGIATRAKSPIGSLYQFFKNKEAVARALRTRQMEDIAVVWSGLGGTAGTASLRGFADRFAASAIEFVRTHPAFLPLLDAPSTTLPLGPRNRLRRHLERLLRALAPGLAAATAARCAEVVLHLNKALMGLYAAARPRDRKWIGDHYRALVHAYLQAQIGHGRARRVGGV